MLLLVFHNFPCKSTCVHFAEIFQNSKLPDSFEKKTVIIIIIDIFRVIAYVTRMKFCSFMGIAGLLLTFDLGTPLLGVVLIAYILFILPFLDLLVLN